VISTNYTIKSKRKIYGIFGALITLIFPYFLLLNNQDNQLETAQSLCPFMMLTGFPCPGCGITKSLVYCYQADFIKSLSYHILGPLVIVFCLFTIVLLTIEIVNKRDYFTNLFFNKKLAYGLGIFLGIYHFIRIVIYIKNNSLDYIIRQSIWR
jgi:hypothetical protein